MFSYYQVKGQSMEPLCREGDFVFVNRATYLLSHPKEGEIVVLHHPEDPAKLLIKRIKYVRPQGSKPWYWVEGDNVRSSEDSRSFGWMPREAIVGKAKVIHRTSS